MIPLLASLLLYLPAFCAAYTWNFVSPPQQCKNLTIQVSGDGGKPPYSVLIVPIGPTPFSNNTEVRRIVNQAFPSDATEVSFRLNFPVNSQLVAVVSDANGFATGGTSAAASVTDSDDTSCYNTTGDVSPAFTFSIDPNNILVQCTPTRIWWTASAVQGDPAFYGVIPGGESFTIPQSNVNTVQSQGTGFSWTPNIRGGTTCLVVGGDNRGIGSGGSSPQTINSGSDNNSTCLDSSSPSSTAGNPAGGSYPTSSTGAGVGGGSSGSDSSGSSGSSGSSTNVGAIVGGVIGGVALLIACLLFLLFLRRRSRLHKKQNEKPVDLLHNDDEDTPGPGREQTRNELPQYYQPEPFIVPDPTVTSDVASSSDPSRRFSSSNVTSTSGPDGVGSSTTRKGGMPPRLRPVNIIQHDDAGPQPGAEEEPETIELPPAYTNIRKAPAAAGEGSTSAAQSEGAGSSSATPSHAH